MICVTVFQDSQQQTIGLECRGHAGFDVEGRDIICAAVSALTLNMANSVESLTHDSFTGEVDEESGGFSFHFTGQVSRESRLLMDSLVLGLTQIQESYGNEYIAIGFKEV